MTHVERRETSRVDVEIAVNYSYAEKALAKNISIKGLKIITSRMMAKGTVLFLALTLPDKELVKVIGEVRWSRNSGPNEFETGIEFFFMDNLYREKINHFIEHACNEHAGCREKNQ
ncbi:MAG: PilZ domain-containing protein [Spirochaetales bacterium]|nr:PilZ domain-containing protein [Spirochaetales bacterium]